MTGYIARADTTTIGAGRSDLQILTTALYVRSLPPPNLSVFASAGKIDPKSLHHRPARDIVETLLASEPLEATVLRGTSHRSAWPDSMRAEQTHTLERLHKRNAGMMKSVALVAATLEPLFRERRDGTMRYQAMPDSTLHRMLQRADAILGEAMQRYLTANSGLRSTDATALYLNSSTRVRLDDKTATYHLLGYHAYLNLRLELECWRRKFATLVDTSPSGDAVRLEESCRRLLDRMRYKPQPVVRSPFVDAMHKLGSWFGGEANAIELVALRHIAITLREYAYISAADEATQRTALKDLQTLVEEINQSERDPYRKKELKRYLESSPHIGASVPRNRPSRWRFGWQ